MTVLLPALAGCVDAHKADSAPIPLLANAPSLLTPPATPVTLVSADMQVPVPDLPIPALPSAQPTPPPPSAITDTHKRNRRRGHKAEQEVAEREAHERELREREADKAQDKTPPPGDTTQTAQAPNSKVTAATPAGDLAQPTSIGQLTAGPAQDTIASRQQAAQLIDATEQGVNTLKNLNTDQNKTVIQIRSFLEQAQRALHNGDVDGASTLATKAKTLLDELTGAH